MRGMPMTSDVAARDLFLTRDIADLVEETGGEGERLAKTMGPFTLTALGVGAIIGTGIFVVIGQGAQLAGPGVILSFVLGAVTCAFSALSYAELASAVDAFAGLGPDDVDLLVCGSRGYGPARRVLLGGVSARLLRHARVPVMVVPLALTADDGPTCRPPPAAGHG